VPDGNKSSWRKKIDNGLDQAFALLVLLTYLIQTGDFIFVAISRTLSSRRIDGFAKNMNLETKYSSLVSFYLPLLNSTH
jgi:hypothetical protein